MALPIVAIVGRPNVGKSTLFNKLIGKRLSIVDDTPGVTRDRIYSKCEWLGREFMLVDTGGIEPKSSDSILAQMRRQAEIAIDRACVIILVTDLRCGVTATDYDVASMLQKSGKPVILCVNKCDRLGDPSPEFYEFYNLGLGDPVEVSSVHGYGTGDLLDRVLECIPDNRNFHCVGFFHHFTGEISFDIGNSSKRAVDSPDIRTRQRIPVFIHYPPFDVPDFTSSRYRLHSTDSDKMLFHLIFKRFPFQYFLKCRQRSQLAYTDTYPICADICTRKIHLITGHIAELLQSLSQWRFL